MGNRAHAAVLGSIELITAPFLCTFTVRLVSIPLYMLSLQIVTMPIPAWSISYIYSKEAARFTKVLVSELVPPTIITLEISDAVEATSSLETA
ncbi:hypothetical protein EV424DRAFT_1460423 [Suillus variegatus]|nr:hypothetical protein EV424DRAFT_1460423 [Suillus variegatus]